MLFVFCLQQLSCDAAMAKDTTTYSCPTGYSYSGASVASFSNFATDCCMVSAIQSFELHQQHFWVAFWAYPETLTANMQAYDLERPSLVRSTYTSLSVDCRTALYFPHAEGCAYLCYRWPDLLCWHSTQWRCQQQSIHRLPVSVLPGKAARCC